MIDWTKIKTKEARLAARKEKLLEDMRNLRNKELRETDYLLLPDAPITENERTEVLTYRQSLRELTDSVATAPDYQVNYNYIAGNVFIYDGNAYVVVMGHTSQADWVPGMLPALYRYLGEAELLREENAVPEWIQPQGSHDAYNTGDRVMFEGGVYESLIDANTWSPTAYPAGWQLIS